jgi:TniQ
MHDESSLAYVGRVADSNAMDASQFLSLLSPDTVFDQWQQLHQRLCLETTDTAKLIGPFPQSWQVTCTLRGIATVEFNHLHRRWCPLCLQEQPYFKGVWGLKLSCVCISHACYLIALCGQCKQPQSWQCANLFVCMHCGASLYKSPTQVASPMMVTLQCALVVNLIGVRGEIFPELDTTAWIRLIRYLGQFNGSELPKRPGQISGLHHLEVAKDCMHNVAHLFADWPHNFEKLLQAIQTSLLPTSSLKKTFGVLYRVLYFHLREERYQFLRDAFEAYLHQHWWGMVCKRNRAFKSSTILEHPRLTLKQAAKQTGLAPALIRHLSTSKLIDKNHINLPSGRQVSSFHQADLPHIEALAKDLLNLQETAHYLAVSERVVRELITAKVIAPLAIRTHTTMANWLIPKQQLQHLFLKASPKQDKDLVSFSGIVKYWRMREGEMVQLVKALIAGELNAFDVSDHSVVIGKALLDKATAKDWLSALRKSLDTMSIDEAAKLLGIKQQVAYHLAKVGLIHIIQTKQAGKQITIEAIETFNHKYVALSVLAKQQQTSPSALLKALKVKPVTGPQIDGGRQYFYLRKHITP